MKQRRSAAVVMASLLGVSLFVGGARGAVAGPEGRRNTTIVLGAATAGALIMKKHTAALVLGAGTAASYVRYRGAKTRQNRKAKREYGYHNDRY